MKNYVAGTVSKILDQNGREIPLIKAMREPKQVCEMVVYDYYNGYTFRVRPEKMECDLIGRALYAYGPDTVYRLTGLTPVLKLEPKDSSIEVISLNQEDDDKISIHFRRDEWKI